MYFIFENFCFFFAVRIFLVAIDIARKRRGARGEGEGGLSTKGNRSFS